MSKLHINIGDSANDRTGDPLRTAFDKVNSNFDELYAFVNTAAAANQLVNGSKIVSLGTEGKLTLPAGTTYAYLAAPLTGHGDGLARLDFTLVTDGVNTQWAAASASPAGSGYSAGDTFTFDAVFLGIPGSSVTIEILTVGLGGSVENLAFTQPPLYPADIYRDSPINLQVGAENNRWTFGTNGKLTLPTGGDIVNSSNVSVLTPPVFDAGGALVYPNTALQRDTGTVSCLGNASTVVYTVSAQYQHTIKLLIQVEGFEGAATQFDTQACEMIIVKSFRANAIAASVYGIVYTSVAPLATFTADWNTLTSRIEVVCATPGTNSVSVRIFATEITTSD